MVQNLILSVKLSPVQMTELASNVSSTGNVKQVLNSGTNEIEHVKFSIDGTRGFALDYLNSTQWQLIESDLSTGLISGDPVLVESVSKDVYGMSRIAIYDFLVTSTRAYIACYRRNSSTEALYQILSYDITSPGHIVQMESETVTLTSYPFKMCLGNPDGVETLFVFVENELQAVDISNPGTPGSPTTHNAMNGKIGGAYLMEMGYAADYLYFLYKK